MCRGSRSYQVVEERFPIPPRDSRASYSNPSRVDHTQTCQVRPSPASESRKQSWAAPDRFTNHLGLLYCAHLLCIPIAQQCAHALVLVEVLAASTTWMPAF